MARSETSKEGFTLTYNTDLPTMQQEKLEKKFMGEWCLLSPRTNFFQYSTRLKEYLDAHWTPQALSVAHHAI